MKKSSPKDLVLAVTYRCNSRCRMCGIWEMKDFGQEWTPKDLANLPSDFRDINLTGGEPFLREDLLQIMETLAWHQPNASIVISSNGFATERISMIAAKLITIKPDLGVAISIDGIGAAHDAIRGIPGGFDKAMATFKNLRALGVDRLKLGFTLGDYNIDQLKPVYELARSLGAELTLTLVHSSDNFFHKENTREKSAEMAAALHWLVRQELKTWQWKNWGRAFYAWGMARFILTGNRVLPDYSGIDNVFIDPYGTIYPCDISSERIGALTETGPWQKPVRQDCAQSWMFCTARPAMWRHKWYVLAWAIRNKMLVELKSFRLTNQRIITTNARIR